MSTEPPLDKQLGPFTISLHIADGHARLEIYTPLGSHVGSWYEVIDALADRWGSRGNQDGTMLWAELDWRHH